MDARLRRCFRQVRLRVELNRAFDYAIVALMVWTAIALVAVCLHRFVALPVAEANRLAAWGAGAVFILAGLVWWVRRPQTAQLALVVDERAGLKERISTSLALASAPGGFAACVRRDAHEAVDRVKPAEHFPLRAPRRTPWGLGGLVLLAIAFLAIPKVDLTGALAKQDDAKKNEAERRETEKKVEDVLEKVKATTNELKMAELNKDVLAEVKLPPDAKPDEIRLAAIKKLSGLGQELKRQRAEGDFGRLDALRQQLRGLKMTGDDALKNLTSSMAKANFTGAREALKELQRQLSSPNLTDEQREKLAEQLEKLAEQLDRLAQERKQLEQDLQKMGLDKKLAALDPESLRKALENMSQLTKEQREKLLQMAKSQEGACQTCQGLSKGLAGAAAAMSRGGGQGELDKFDEQMALLEALQSDLDALQAAVNDVYAGLDELGEGMCQACMGQGECAMCGGGKGPWQAGLNWDRGNGMGGPGRGQGQSADKQATNVNFNKTRVQGELTPGSVTASWFFEGDTVRGEAVQDRQDVALSAEKQANDAIRDNDIPRHYHGPIKKYFGDVRDRTAATSEPATEP